MPPVLHAASVFDFTIGVTRELLTSWQHVRMDAVYDGAEPELLLDSLRAVVSLQQHNPSQLQGMVWYGIFIFQRQYKVIRKQN